MNTGNFVLPVQAAIVFFAIFVLLCSIVLVGHIIEKRRGQSRTIQALNTRVYSWLWLSIILMIALYGWAWLHCFFAFHLLLCVNL